MDRLRKEDTDRIRDWLKVNGIPGNSPVCGYFRHPTVVYMDKVVRLVASRENEMLEVTRLENRNPVICVNAEGHIIRTHGEYGLVATHIEELTMPRNPEPKPDPLETANTVALDLTRSSHDAKTEMADLDRNMFGPGDAPEGGPGAVGMSEEIVYRTR